MALGEFLTRLQDTLGRKVDLGLVGDSGVVHPSLQVRASLLVCLFPLLLATISSPGFANQNVYLGAVRFSRVSRCWHHDRVRSYSYCPSIKGG